MLVSEAVVLTCSLLALRWGMAADGGQGAYEDMAVYSVMCSISTACAFTITVILVAVPEHVCTTYNMPAKDPGLLVHSTVLHYTVLLDSISDMHL